MSELSEQIMVIRAAKKEIDRLNERIAYLERELSETKRVKSEYDQQLFECSRKIDFLEAQLQRYQGGVEVEATLNFNLDSRKWEFVSWNVIEGRLLDCDNKRVRMHVKEVA